MKKSLMNNIKNFVDSNVRQRIDRVSHNNNEFFTDDLLLVERHFEDIRRVCVDAEKKISTLLQSIQANGSSTQLSAYTQNVQAGLNSLSHNTNQPTTSLTTNAGVASSGNLSYVQHSFSNDANQACQYRSDDSLSYNQQQTINVFGTANQSVQAHDQQINQHDAEQHLSEDLKQRHKKLPTVGFLRFLSKTSQKVKPDSLLALSLCHCTQLQSQLTILYLTYEQNIEAQCLKPIQYMIEHDIPSVVKLRKLFIKSHNDLESFRAKYNGASQKQQQYIQSQQIQTSSSSASSYTITQTGAQHISANKLDQAKKELDEAIVRFEQARDTYEAEIYGFVCREAELVNLIVRFYRLQAEYHRQLSAIIEGSLPSLCNTLACTPRKSAFGTALDEHLRCTGRAISPVLEICVHLLCAQGLKEEGLFRIPGSSIKIKKLKNAINAWFINLTSLNELEHDQTRQTGHSCVIALFDLFKNVVGRPSETLASSTDTDEVSDNATSDSEVILDVHSIAGLLKLYLRELPEPLFTHMLYDQWIDALNSTSNTCSAMSKDHQDASVGQQLRNEARCKALRQVILKLPNSNYHNLKHLIKFLHLLTSNQQFNKMTSTNLAIAMAPSLIWSKPTESKDNRGTTPDEESSNAAQSLSMSSFGISASLHAMLVDTLINNAGMLFPESADFTLPGFKDLSLATIKHRDHSKERPLKSTSPAGLSIASSSSYSSNASNPVNANIKSGGTMVRTHSRKGGSMEGLLTKCADDMDATKAQTSSTSTTGSAQIGNRRPSATMIQRGNAIRSNRPVSVQIKREDYANLSKVSAPPVPPIPIARSQNARHVTRNLSEDTSDNTGLHEVRGSCKPPAPPIPPTPTGLKLNQDILKRESMVTTPDPSSSTIQSEVHTNQNELASKLSAKPPPAAPRPASLRGTGTISSPMSGALLDSSHNLKATRPSVPPPQRPTSSGKSQEPISHGVKSSSDVSAAGEPCRANVDSQSGQALTSLLSPFSVEDTHGNSASPVISLDSLTMASDISSDSDELDSSFEEVNSSYHKASRSLAEDINSDELNEASNIKDACASSDNDPSRSAKLSGGGQMRRQSIDGDVEICDIASEKTLTFGLNSGRDDLYDSKEQTASNHRLAGMAKLRLADSSNAKDESSRETQEQEQCPVRPLRSASPKSSAPSATTATVKQQRK